MLPYNRDRAVNKMINMASRLLDIPESEAREILAEHGVMTLEEEILQDARRDRRTARTIAALAYLDDSTRYFRAVVRQGGR